MVNVLYYEPSSGFGGSSSNLFHILNKLDKSKYCPIVLTHNEGAQFDRIKHIGIKVYQIPYEHLDEINKSGNIQLMIALITKVIPFSFKLMKLIKKEKIQLVHSNTNVIQSIAMIIAARMSKKPIFCYIRETRAFIKREKIISKFVNQFIVLSKAAFQLYENDIPKEKINIIYDGVDLDSFKNIDSEVLAKEFPVKGFKTIGLAGRIVRGKGYREFVLAAKKVCQNIPNSKFIIIGAPKGGDEQYFNEVKELVKTENLEEKIIFTGWRTDVENIVAGLDILVLASTTFPEGLPNSIIEAMALNKPAIATDIPGPPEIIDDGKTGFIVPPGDVEVMAEKIIYLLENKKVAVDMGLQGRKRVEELFDVTKAVKKIEELYEK